MDRRLARGPTGRPDRGVRRDFRALLALDRCWDQGVEEIYRATGEPAVDAILQNREELLALCEFIEAFEIRSFLEIGIWTGRLVSTLQRLFSFDKVAACDQGYAERLGLPIHLPPEVDFLRANSDSPAFLAWREALGPVDLVLIDANHGYRAVCRDLEINRGYPHRFLALHDIAGANRHTTGVRRCWTEIDRGWKRELVRPHRELGLDHSVMGIGIWASEPPDPLPTGW